MPKNAEGIFLQVIYLINEQIHINGCSRNESFEIQQNALADFIQKERLEPVRLNLYQLNEHYTIPHALLYDLKLNKKQIDCLLFYSGQSIKDFASTYPARWLILKSYFDRVLTII
jgi:ubiquinone biosynthesis protein COQ9